MRSDRNVWVTGVLPNRQEGVMLRKHRRVGAHVENRAICSWGTTGNTSAMDFGQWKEGLPNASGRHGSNAVGNGGKELPDSNGAPAAADDTKGARPICHTILHERVERCPGRSELLCIPAATHNVTTRWRAAPTDHRSTSTPPYSAGIGRTVTRRKG